MISFMQLESMFTEQKWNILQELALLPQSPLQLSQKLNTTMANISQQLKLLEAVNLVQKEKIRNRDKGKPRTLFSLKGEYAFLIPVTKHFAQKKLIYTNEHQKAILRIWFLENNQERIEKWYWEIKEKLKEVHSVVVDQTSNKIYVMSDSKEHARELSKGKDLVIEHLSTKEFSALFAKISTHNLAFLHGQPGGPK